MIYRFLPLVLLSLMSFDSIKETKVKQNDNIVIATDPKDIAANKKVAFEASCKSFYQSIEANNYSLPQYESFFKAFEGYSQLQQQGLIENEYLTIVDFSLSSKEERLWVIDMNTKMVVLQSLVAHGKNSGMEFANQFSNKSESYQSSLGFYLTGETYTGKHGLSLKIDGLEYGINNNARQRAVVIHGADYASEKFVKANGRLGRSQGCPAVPYTVHKTLIETIKGKSCLFIYHPSRSYVEKSKLVS
ncbi:murein L,D-transpeptidase catalytic domain family protein [Flavobacterium chuncheonense]|uniref:Murein L,D-transpeptidase catalytic domain family protein n=1 Tax=Flavobacterium chuncheonense TaxID=2026653 RepID=A0ABW5YL69_9FLAO